MKKIKLSSKLTLNKSVISTLNTEESSGVKGGSGRTHCFCDEISLIKTKCICIPFSETPKCASIKIACIPWSETPKCGI